MCTDNLSFVISHFAWYHLIQLILLLGVISWVSILWGSLVYLCQQVSRVLKLKAEVAVVYTRDPSPERKLVRISITRLYYIVVVNYFRLRRGWRHCPSTTWFTSWTASWTSGTASIAHTRSSQAAPRRRFPRQFRRWSTARPETPSSSFLGWWQTWLSLWKHNRFDHYHQCHCNWLILYTTLTLHCFWCKSLLPIAGQSTAMIAQFV